MANIKEDLTGRIFGRLKVIGHVSGVGGGWKCQCSCDNKTIVIVETNRLTSGKTQSCGCLRKELAGIRSTSNLVGQKFGRLTVQYRDGSDIHGNAIWVCTCDCGSGRTVRVPSTQLIRGHTQSCGCYKRDQGIAAHTKYEDATTKYLAIRKFGSMKDRCLNPKCKSYPDWGGRGITICQEWLDDPKKFAEWAIAHGYRKGLTVGRKDNDGPYSPENCRFETYKQQNVNKRSSRFITIDGITKTISQWSQEVGIPQGNLYQLKSDEKIKAQIEKKLRSAAKTEASAAEQ